MKKKKIREERLAAWFNGELEDDDLTIAEVNDLERRVFDAISANMLARPDVHTFAQHRTVQ